MVADLETLICKFVRYDCEFYKAFFFFSGPPVDPAYLRHFLNSLKVSISLPKLGLCFQVLGLMSVTGSSYSY